MQKMHIANANSVCAKNATTAIVIPATCGELVESKAGI